MTKNQEKTTGEEANIKGVADGRIKISMGGKGDWGNKVTRLREILKVAAPKKQRMPAYTFESYYYVGDGMWFETSWDSRGAVPVLEIKD